MGPREKISAFMLSTPVVHMCVDKCRCKRKHTHTLTHAHTHSQPTLDRPEVPHRDFHVVRLRHGAAVALRAAREADAIVVALPRVSLAHCLVDHAERWACVSVCVVCVCMVCVCVVCVCVVCVCVCVCVERECA
jgi:hypothetical protein